MVERDTVDVRGDTEERDPPRRGDGSGGADGGLADAKQRD